MPNLDAPTFWYVFSKAFMRQVANRMFKSSHEIRDLAIVWFVFLQTCMPSYPAGPDLRFLSKASSSSLYCVRKQRRLWLDCGCAGMPDPLLWAYVISSLFSWTGPTLSCNQFGFKIKWTAARQNQKHDLCAQRPLKSALASIQSDRSLHCPLWRNLGSLAIPKAQSEGSDQTGWMPRLIWVFAGRTCHFDGFVMLRLKLIH